jgi:hypothetical protein
MLGAPHGGEKWFVFMANILWGYPSIGDALFKA